mgnify:CR=1 FL=1
MLDYFDVIAFNFIASLIVSIACWILYFRQKSYLVMTMAITSTIVTVTQILFLQPVAQSLPIVAATLSPLLRLTHFVNLAFAGCFLAFALKK